MPNPKFTFSIDQELLDALNAHTAALNRFCDAQANSPAVAEPAPVEAEQVTAPAEPVPAPVEAPVVAPMPAPQVFPVAQPPVVLPTQPNDVPQGVQPTVQVPWFQTPVTPGAPVLDAPVAAPAMPAQVAQPAPQQPAPMPTTGGTTVTLESLMVAGVELMNRNIDSTAVLREFGIQSMSQLRQDQYPAFAARLRQLGANI